MAVKLSERYDVLTCSDMACKSTKNLFDLAGHGNPSDVICQSCLELGCKVKCSETDNEDETLFNYNNHIFCESYLQEIDKEIEDENSYDKEDTFKPREI